VKREDGTLAGGRANSSESSLVLRTATPTCTIHCIFRVSRLLFVYLRTPKAHSPLFRSRTFHTHIVESPTTFSISYWTVPSFRRQDAGCHRGGPVSDPGHTVRVFRWTEWHWDSFSRHYHSANAPYSLYNSSSWQGDK